MKGFFLCPTTTVSVDPSGVEDLLPGRAGAKAKKARRPIAATTTAGRAATGVTIPPPGAETTAGHSGAVNAPTRIAHSAAEARMRAPAEKAMHDPTATTTPGLAVKAMRVRPAATTGPTAATGRSATSRPATADVTTPVPPVVATRDRTATAILGRAGVTTADGSSVIGTDLRRIGPAETPVAASVRIARPVTAAATTHAAEPAATAAIAVAPTTAVEATIAEPAATAVIAAVAKPLVVVAAKADSARQGDVTVLLPGAMPAPTSRTCPRTSKPRNWTRRSGATSSVSTS